LDAAGLARDFAAGMMLADALAPTWGGYRPGLGPHTEVQTVALVMAELSRTHPAIYGAVQTGVPYPNAPRQKCDLLIAPTNGRSWAIEVKMLRFIGDNGKTQRQHADAHSVTISEAPKRADRLSEARGLRIRGAWALLIYGYDYDDWPMQPAVEAFEQLAKYRVRLGPREFASFDGLIHPVHQRGGVFVWEISSLDRE
jgi:hypothetical protein